MAILSGYGQAQAADQAEQDKNAATRRKGFADLFGKLAFDDRLPDEAKQDMFQRQMTLLQGKEPKGIYDVPAHYMHHVSQPGPTQVAPEQPLGPSAPSLPELQYPGQAPSAPPNLPSIQAGGLPYDVQVPFMKTQEQRQAESDAASEKEFQSQKRLKEMEGGITTEGKIKEERVKGEEARKTEGAKPVKPPTVPGELGAALDAQRIIDEETAKPNTHTPGELAIAHQTVDAYKKPKPAVAKTRLEMEKDLEDPNIPAAEKEVTRKTLARDEEFEHRKAGWSGEATEPDAHAIADGVRAGLIPPDLSTVGAMGKIKGQVTADLARSDYNQAQATTEWKAVQRWMASANSSQQLRLRQNMAKIVPHTKVIENLYGQLEKEKLPGGFKLWNRAALAAAANISGKTGALATNIQGQINDLAAELGSIYMGGNTPVEKALEMAASNLHSEWNPETFHMAMDLIRKNVVMRDNAVKYTGPAGFSGTSQYIPGGIAQPQLPQGGGQTPAGNRPPLSSYETNR
jgi:hypothetical protein